MCQALERFFLEITGYFLYVSGNSSLQPDHGGLLHGLKLKIGTTFALLIGIGMVLINVVVTMFWQRDMIHSEIGRFQTAMAVTAGFITRDGVDPGNAVRQLSSMTGVICSRVQFDHFKPATVPENCQYTGRLSKLAGQAAITGKMQVRGRQPGIGLFPTSNRYLFLSMPLAAESGATGAISLAVSVKPLFKQLVANQKAVFLYILINLLGLMVIGMVRVTRIVIRPIERLAQLSETYTTDEGLSFMAATDDNEFRRLTLSLNQMIQRIEADKDKLKVSVQSLQAANQQLKATQQEMVRTEKLAAVGRLAAGLAHEIGNPVGIVQGYLDLMAQPDVPVAEKKDYLARSEKELSRIDGLIRRLLDFSRPGQQTPARISIHQLLAESVDMFKVQSKKEGVDIVLQLQASKDTVFADPDQLNQVFINCLLNAVDAVGMVTGGERRVTITTEQRQPDPAPSAVPWIRIRIQDNGPGIQPADLSKVFDPFFTTKEPGQGTGLGLFVSHAIIENCGGRMRVETTGPSGTTIAVDLPLYKEPENNFTRPDL